MGHKSVGVWLLLLGALLSTGCGDDDDDEGGEGGEGGANNAGNDDGSGDDSACGTLCTDAGFSGGEEADYSSGTVMECTCSGSGEGIAQDDCSAYCEAFDIGADKAFLSSEASDNDKCVCDGT